MKLYLLGQGVFHFVNGSFPYPLSQFVDSMVLLFISIILSILLSSLFMGVLHLVVDCQTSCCVWCALEQAFASPSNSRIMQLYGSFQDLCQGDDFVIIFLQNVKSLFDELAAVIGLISLENFNLYVFCGFHSEFKDLLTSLSTKT